MVGSSTFRKMVELDPPLEVLTKSMAVPKSPTDGVEGLVFQDAGGTDAESTSF